MRKIKAWQHSRKLALGIAFALGCSMAASASAQVIEAPITGDAAVDTAYKDFIELNGSTPSYAFDKDATIKVDSSVNTPLQFTANGNTYDVAAGIAAMSTKATYLYLSPNDSTLSIDVTAHGDAIGAGMLQTGAQQAIFTTNGKVANYNITVTGADDNTKKSYGIWRSMINTNNKGMFINSNKGDYSSKKVNIDIKNANGGYGIAASAPEGVDNLASNASAIWIYGNVNVNVSENKKAADLLDNSAGLYVNLKDSKINIDGYADLNVAGNGIVVNAADGQASVTVTKGGRINVLASEDGSDRYAIYNQGGRVYYGAATLAGLNNYRGPVIQGNRTQIDGDVYVGDSSAGVLWIGATGADSYLKGVIKEAGEFSNVGMALNDGAVWYNQAANKGNVGTDTVFNKISGTNGLIYQNALSGKVTIDSLESNALNIAYEHDKTTPEKILGGDVTIVKAENKSELNVFTDYDSNMNTDASREAVLNALAKKIYYTGYKTGEDNISGTVSIAEGLTTRSAKKYFADMSFDKATGQGYFAKDTTVQEITKPGAQKETEFIKAILGDRSNKKYYEDAGVFVNGKYNFTADTTMNVENNSQVAGTWLWATAAGIYSGYNQENVNLDLNGKKLNINLVTDQDTAGIAAIAANSKVEIDNAGPMSVYAESTKGSNVATLFVNGGGHLFIHNGGDDAESKILTLRGKTTNSTNGVVIKSKNGVSGERSWLKVDGLVDIEADTTDGVGMAEGLLAVASTIDVGGGRIVMSASGKNPGVSYGDNATNCAIRAYGEFVSPNTGIVNVNVIKDEDTATGKAIAADNNRTQINGNFNTVGGMGTKGTINVGLNTADSYWIGNYINGAGWGVTPGDYGVVNLFMGNGAQWKGYSKFATNLKMDSGASWEGHSINKAVSATIKNGATWYNNNTPEIGKDGLNTTLKALRGGASIAEAGFVDMTTEGVRDTSVDNYSGHTKLIYKRDADTPTAVLGGNFTVGSAEKGSYISLLTNDSGLNLNNNTVVSETLGNLANKLYYTGAMTGEDNITSFVSINDALKGDSTNKRVGSVIFDETTGQGKLDWVAEKAQTKLAYTDAITGNIDTNINYVKDGVLDIESKEYSFTKKTTNLTVDNHTIPGGPWIAAIGAAISGAAGTNTQINLNGNSMNVTGIANSHSTGIAAIADGVVELHNAGAMNVTANGGGQTAALFANGGGQLTIHNGDGDLEKKVLTARASASYKNNGAVIKTMNGKNGVTSKITIDGLVDVLADGVNSNEAVSAVASTIDIGGGRIEAANGAWAAIRAYGEFVSPNYGVVNFNVLKDEDGNAIGAGDNRAVVIGDVVTNGGMGTKGRISLGMKGENSYWEGNYADTRGYGVTQGQLGAVNLFMEDGAHWKGFGNGSMNVKLDGAKTNWYGFSISDGLQLSLKNGATWYNAITAEQVDQSSKHTDAKIGWLTSDNGFIDMTGSRVFTAKSSSLNGGTTADGSSSITESENGITGNVVVNNYSGNATVIYKHQKDKDGISIVGGNFTIKNAAEGSKITLSTDNNGIDVDNIYDVNDTLGGLAKKLFYLGYIDGERNLDGYVQIAEGLTSRSAAMRAGDVSFDEGTGQGSYDASSLKPEIKYPTFQTDVAYSKAITGNVRNDIEYVKTGVLDTETGKYNFTQNTKLDVENHTIPGGPWIAAIGAAISGAAGTNTQIDLNGKSIEVNAANKGHSTGIAAIADGVVELHNAGAMNVTANGGGQTAALFANGGGQLTIHNGDGDLEKKVLTARASASYKNNGAVIKTMNGKNGVTSKITIDGLVDVLADGVNSNEAVSAVASTIDIGGGRIEAANGAWAAIRAYGEFVSPNYGVVNFNVLKDEDGNAIGAGDNRAVVIGDVVTNGGMGTKGRISLGMKGENSYWEGNYADTRGYGVTQGQLGAVNLFMEDGAHWKGFGNGSMNVKLDGAKTNWYGFSISDGLQLSLKNGATWYNAITAEQVDQSSKHTDAKIGWLTSDNGFIDMTGSRVFTAKSSSLNGGTTADGSSSITESENGITGNVVVNNYSGNATVIYKHTKTNDGIDVIGGNFTIKNAAEGSKITLSTDNNGIDTSNPDDVQGTLNQLANKLYYLGAIDGAESNLDGYVQIAEGLTSSSAALKLGDVEFSGEDGKGSLAAGSVVTPDSKKNPAVIYGDKETAMMKGAKTAMVSNALLWRAENNDLMKRMGDLRLSEGESGIWAKYYGGKYSMDGQNTNMSVRYNAYQVGYDKEVGNGWKAGVALSYDDGSSSYGTGHADLKNTSLGLYGTWTGEDGQYLDLIAKCSRLENEYDVRNLYGHKLAGDYKTWGASLSAEYGKRFEMDKGFYVDPSVELTLGRVAGKDYTAASDYLDAFGKNKSLAVEQDAFTSLIGRVGVRLGQKLDNASYFVKLAAAHEFSGDFDSTYRVEGEPDGRTSISFNDTWFEAQLGGSVKLNDNSMVYASFERSFGGDVEQKWRVDAGLRWSF